MYTSVWLCLYTYISESIVLNFSVNWYIENKINMTIRIMFTFFVCKIIIGLTYWSKKGLQSPSSTKKRNFD